MQRKGKDVGLYYTNYAKQDVSVRVVRLEGRLVLAAHIAGAPAPSYFVLLDFDGDILNFIRDFRYVPYIATDGRALTSTRVTRSWPRMARSRRR